MSYGIFVSTKFGDGLIHVSNISYAYFDRDWIPELFKIGEKIPVFLIGHQNGNLQLSLKHLENTEFEEQYLSLLYSYDDDLTGKLQEEDSEKFRLEVEKGFVFEQYAAFQPSIDKKIKYLKFAKAYFSNTKNSRSYLLNIYIEYFNSLSSLDNLIENYSFQKYKDFRQVILQIKEKVQPRTLESYPESKNLLFFIDILNLFNSKKEDDLDYLYSLIRKSIEEKDSLLKVVAKTTLANNLLISEISTENFEELNNFTLKNLKRIREYIALGVLSLKDTIEDKVSLELRKEKDVLAKNH